MKLCNGYYIGEIIDDGSVAQRTDIIVPFGELSYLLRVRIKWKASSALVYSRRQDRYIDLPVSVNVGDEVLVLRFDTQPLALRGTNEPRFIIGRLIDILGVYENKHNTRENKEAR